MFIGAVERAGERCRKRRGVRRFSRRSRKELIQLFRDRLSLTLALVLARFLLLLMGTALSLTVDDMPIVVQDFDGSPSSQHFINAFRASLTFHIVAVAGQRLPRATR